MTHDITPALQHYQTALNTWEAQVAANSATLDHALAVLRRRDALQQTLPSLPSPGIYRLQQLQHLDQQLRQQGGAMTAVVDFAAYRRTVSPPETHWWWYLDTLQPAHDRERLDWLWRGTGVLVWTISLGLLGDISRRFLLGGPGVLGVSAIAFSSLLTLLNARSELVSAGQAGFDQLLEKLDIPAHWHEEAKLSTTGLLFLFLLGLWGALPNLSEHYNQVGMADNSAGRFGSAQQNYQRAIALDPNNANAYYNLGSLYEDLQKFDQAETQYRIAAQGDVPQAYNNLGRLYLLPARANPDGAVTLLFQGLDLLEPQEEELKAEEEFFSTQYNLYKNLGWARLQQGRYEEAEFPLQAAIGVLERTKAEDREDEIKNPASAHCLLAQVLDQQREVARALISWATCYQLGKSTNPDEDTWMFQACQRLKEENQPCLKL